MSQRWTFDAAIDFWLEHHKTDVDPVWDRFTAAEAHILDHRPRTSAEAELILKVLIEQGPDGRADGRDHKALLRLHAFIRGLGTAGTVPARGTVQDASCPA